MADRLRYVGTWLSLVEHSLGVRGVGSSNLPVPTILNPTIINPLVCFSSSFFQSSNLVFQFPNCDVIQCGNGLAFGFSGDATVMRQHLTAGHEPL